MCRLDLSMLECPSPMIDPQTGEVAILLIAYKTPEMLGKVSPDDPIFNVPRPPDLPFPIVESIEPVVVRLRPGMKPADVDPAFNFRKNSSVGTTSWWHWSAFAYCPWGWSCWPTVFFERDVISEVAFDRLGEDAPINMKRMILALSAELGEPGDIKPAGKGLWPFRVPEDRRQRAAWQFPWGKVGVYYEPRDWSARTSVNFDPR